jgi:cyanophycinase
MCASKVANGAERGWIIPIGGAEEKENSPQILKRFLELAGGEEADVAIIPTASAMSGTGSRYERIFAEMGARRVVSLDFDTRRDADEPGRLARLREASGVFFTGGNQLRLTTLIGGTPVAQAVRQMNAAGIPVAGTSAGAAFLCEHMIAFGEEGSTPVAGSVRLAPGLGLTNRYIIDQHFRQRDRLGRLLTALAYNPFAVGIGLDEDTAAFIAPDNTVEVEGSGAITVVDAAEVQFSSMDSVDEGHPVCLIGVKIHILVRGATFNLQARRADAGLTQHKRQP